jgi:hypothetical protein
MPHLLAGGRAFLCGTFLAQSVLCALSSILGGSSTRACYLCPFSNWRGLDKAGAAPSACCKSAAVAACAGKERVLWVTNQDDTTGSARTFGGNQKLTLVLTALQVLTWLVDLSAVPSKRTGAGGPGQPACR